MTAFVLHKTEDVSKIVEVVKNFDQEWFEYTFRQDTFFMHRHTHTVQITDFDAKGWEEESYKVNKFVKCKYNFILKNNELNNLLNPILNYLKNLHNGEIAKTMFVKLAAGKKINEHYDDGLYLNAIKRHHIPIITNDEVWFYVDGEKKNLKIGQIWEIDNTKLHKVENLSNYNRVHLIVDILPNDFLGKNFVY
jgi:aspartyl/asparaginyl beta-hydroxylase (cupin superfamily)